MTSKWFPYWVWTCVLKIYRAQWENSGASEAELPSCVGWSRALLATRISPGRWPKWERWTRAVEEPWPKSCRVRHGDYRLRTRVLSVASPFEVSSKADLYATVKAYTAFFRSWS